MSNLASSLTQLKARLERGWDFSIQSFDGSTVTLLDHSLWERLAKKINRTYRTEAAATMAARILELLQVGDESGDTTLRVQIARLFRRTIVSQCNKHVNFEAVERKELAVRLGISPELFTKPQNRGFYEFAKKTGLASSLKAIGHILHVSDETINILKDCSYTSWASVRETAEASLKDAESKYKTEMFRILFYDGTGLVYVDTFDKELRVLTYVRPSESCRFRLCVNTSSRYGHTWCEVINQAGAVHCFSKYRREENERSCEIYPAEMSCPDSAYYWTDYTRDAVLELKVSGELHHALLDEYVRIARHKHNAFQNLTHNCTALGIHFLKIAAGPGVRLPEHKTSTWTVYTPGLYRAASKIAQYLPARINDFAYGFFAIIGNLICRLSNGHKYDPSFKNPDGTWVKDPIDPTQTLRPQFVHWRDLLDPSKMNMSSPIALKAHIIDPALAWRQAEKSKLAPDDPLREQLEGHLPAAWYPSR